MKINVNSITLDEMAEVEELSGSSLAMLADEKAPKAKLLKALVYVVMKRQNPELTIDEVGQMTMDDIDIEGDEAPQKAA